MNSHNYTISKVSVLLVILGLTISLSYAQETGKGENKSRELPLPEIPSGLNSRQEKMTYLLAHFWDALNPEDPALKSDSLFLEQNLSNFFSVMAMADSVSNREGVAALMSKTRTGIHDKIAELAEIYLYDPVSPFFNPESYLHFANSLICDTSVSEAYRVRANYSRNQILKNRIGKTASDFVYIDRDNKEKSFSDFNTEGAYTLLMFYDTDCQDCHKLKQKLITDGDVTRLMVSGKLKIMAIDSFGADKEHWLKDASTWPQDWTIGWSPDGDLDAEEIYVLLTTPTLYLLDTDKTIIGKDLKYKDLPQYLNF